jgi:two-component system NtrC family sensor kinase
MKKRGKGRTRPGELEHERELMRAEKLAGLGQLAGGIAHELNNPLATIAITVEDLQDMLEHENRELAAAWPELPPALTRIQTAVTRCLGIIGGLTEITRNRAPAIEDFAPNALVERLARTLGGVAASQSKTLTTALDPALGSVRCDPGRLEQVILSLLSNALDAVGTGGHIVIRTSAGETSFTVQVEDDGCGIAAEHRERIFEPFFTTKPPGKGTGLGLAVAYSTVRRLGGTLTVDSEPGRGTSVKVTLPVRDGDTVR